MNNSYYSYLYLNVKVILLSLHSNKAILIEFAKGFGSPIIVWFLLYWWFASKRTIGQVFHVALSTLFLSVEYNTCKIFTKTF